MPVGMTILARAAGPERMGRVMALVGMPMLLAPALGPVIGGALLDGASWRLIFFINLPVGGAGAGARGAGAARASRPCGRSGWTSPALALLSPGLAALVAGLASPAGGSPTPSGWRSASC